MHITTLDIQSFRSIGHYEITFEPATPADLWVIVGENNAGKSTVIKALEWVIGDKRFAQPKPALLHDYTTDPAWVGRSQKMRIVVKTPEAEWKRVWTLTGDALRETTALRPETNHLVLIEPHQSEYLHQLAKAEGTNTVWGLVCQEMDQDPTALDAWANAIAEALQGTPGVYAATWRGGPDSPAAEGLWINDGTERPVAEKGPGLQKLVLIHTLEWLVRRTHARKESVPWVLAWDEPEAHLHPQLMRQTAHRLKAISRFTQVFCTTHAPYLVQVAGLDQVLRVSNRAQSAYITGWPVTAAWHDTADPTWRYQYANKTSPAYHQPRTRWRSQQFPDQLRHVMRRPALANEIAVNALFANLVVIVEGESEELYVPWLYRGYRAWLGARRENVARTLPPSLEELAVHLWDIAGYFNTHDAMTVLAFFDIPFAMLTDEDANTRWNNPPEAQTIDGQVTINQYDIKKIKISNETKQAMYNKRDRKEQFMAIVGYHTLIDRYPPHGKGWPPESQTGKWQIEDAIHYLWQSMGRPDVWRRALEASLNYRKSNNKRQTLAPGEAEKLFDAIKDPQNQRALNKIVIAQYITGKTEAPETDPRALARATWSPAHLWLFFRLAVRFWQGQTDSLNPRLNPHGAYDHRRKAGNWADIAKQIGGCAYMTHGPVDPRRAWQVVDTHAGRPESPVARTTDAQTRWRQILDRTMPIKTSAPWVSLGHLVWRWIEQRLQPPQAKQPPRMYYWVDTDAGVQEETAAWLNDQTTEGVTRPLLINDDGWTVLAGIATRAEPHKRPLFAVIDPPYRPDLSDRYAMQLAMITLAQTPDAYGLAWYPLKTADDTYPPPPTCQSIRVMEWTWTDREAEAEGLAGCGLWMIEPQPDRWARTLAQADEWTHDCWPDGTVRIRIPEPADNPTMTRPEA